MNLFPFKNKKQVISVIIPTLWKIDRLYQTIDELNECEYVDDIILIDNTGIKKNISGKKLTYILEKENTYVNPAWNKGVHLSKNDKICILNDDVWFDWNRLNEISDSITQDIGLIGMSPNNYKLSEDKNLVLSKIESDWKTQKGYRPPGYGCCLFIHKNNWIDIPTEIKIWAGDDFIFYYKNNLSNYILDGLKCDGFMSATNDAFQEFDSIRNNDMYLIRDLIKTGCVENYLLGTIWE